MRRLRVVAMLAAPALVIGCSFVGLGGLTGGGSPDASVEGSSGEGGRDAPTADVVPTIDGGDAGAATDATSAADETTPDPGILCNSTRCDPTSQYCCFRYVTGTGYVYTCTPDDDAASCTKSLKVRCSSDRDCVAQGFPDEVCCAIYSDAGYALTVNCEDPAVCAAYPLHAIYCDPSAPECDAGQTCQADSEEPGFFMCH